MFIHIMTINQGIGIRKIGFVSRVQKDTSRQGKIAIDVFVHISQICFTLKNGIINIGAVYGNPCNHVRIDGTQLIKARATIRITLRLQLADLILNRFRLMINLCIIPDGISRKCSRRHKESAQDQTIYFI